MVPPTVAESRAARSTPYSKPARPAWARNAAMVTPAPAVTCPATASTGPSAVSRRVDSTTGAGPGERGPAGAGTDPPTRPVLPPCGISGTRRAAQQRSTAAASAAEPGRTTQAAVPW